MTLKDLAKKPLERSEVVLQSVLSIEANVETNSLLNIGEVLCSSDNGTTWRVFESLPEGDYTLGILGDYIKENAKANIILMGKVKAIKEIASDIKAALFKHRIILTD